MLRSRNLDDQQYAEIVERAIKRIPQLNESWTNFNPADPGVTLVELLAWYKEMQQYHMNVYTDALKLKLLKLLGIVPEPTKAAVCSIRLPHYIKGIRKGSRLSTSESVRFLMMEPVPAARALIRSIYVYSEEGYRDIRQIMTIAKNPVPVFSFGLTDKTVLVVSFGSLPKEELSLWIDISQPEGPVRNAPVPGQKPPRKLRYTAGNAGEIVPETDETFSFSSSGFIRFRIPENWEKEQLPGEREPSYVLRIEVLDKGCEEEVLLREISADHFRLSQQEVWTDMRFETLKADMEPEFLYDDAAAQTGCFIAFLKNGRVWKQTEAEIITTDGLRGVRLKERPENKETNNVLVCCGDPFHFESLFFDSDGLPNQRIRLDVGDSQILEESFFLLCDAIAADGSIYQEIWSCTDDLYSCGPNAAVFSYNAKDAELVFGDGEHGKIPPKGEKVIYAAALSITEGQMGNIPAGKSLRLEKSTREYENTEAMGGADKESISACQSRLLQKLHNPEVLVTAEDYERMARHTPGRRIQAVRAVPGYDPEDPSGQARGNVVTVVVIPAGNRQYPEPDERYLEAVSAHLERRRNICTKILVKGPRYIPIYIRAELEVSSYVEDEDIRAALEAQLVPGKDADSIKIGDGILMVWLYAVLQRLPGVISVRQASLRSGSHLCTTNGLGDLLLPPDGVPYIAGLSLVRR